MAHPVVAIIVAKAAEKIGEKIGERIGEEIGDLIFGEEDDFGEIKEMLQKMEKQIGEILEYSRATFSLVSELPDVILDLLNEQTLYNAHISLDSSYETYIRLPHLNSTIGHNTFSNLLTNWNTIIDMEHSVEKLIELPKYAEFLILISGGKLFNKVQSEFTKKENLVKSALKAEQEELNNLFALTNINISSEYIESGKILDKEPWITWLAKKNKLKEETKCFWMHIQGDSFERCITSNVPDKPWNNKKNTKNAELQNLKDKIAICINEIRSLIMINEVFERFSKRLEIDYKSKEFNNVEIIESDLMFP